MKLPHTTVVPIRRPLWWFIADPLDDPNDPEAAPLREAVADALLITITTHLGKGVLIYPQANITVVSGNLVFPPRWSAGPGDPVWSFDEGEAQRARKGHLHHLRSQSILFD